jgi:hypothetical protein
MKKCQFLILLFIIPTFWFCKPKTANTERTPILEVEGRFLYLDQIQDIIPTDISKEDSTQIAESYIRKWVTDVLLYENAKRNVSNKSEIDLLIEDYRKSLTIQQYQQKLIDQRLPKEPSKSEMNDFYESFKDEFVLRENIIKGILLIVPKNAPKLANVRTWVQSGNTKALENIEKYSLQNAISYDYFGDRWMNFSEILKKIPLQLEDPASFVANNRFFEKSDSTKHYFLRITAFKRTGETEPFEMAKPKISNLILNKNKAEFISNFEDEIYKDAIENENVTYFLKK